MLAPGEVVGVVEPRLFTPPLRPLTRATTHGFDVIDFAKAIGQPLLPWQEWFVIHALELNPDGTYRFRILLLLVARQNGKTHVSKILKLWKLFVGGARLVLGVGQDLGLAKEVWQLCVDTIQSDPDLRSELNKVRYANGEVEFSLTNGARYMIKAANRSAARGLSVDQLDFEELREQREWQAWAALSKTTAARPMGQIMAFSNAGDDESVVLNQLREAALSGTDPSIGLIEYSAPDGCALDDWPAIAQANPSLGHLPSLAGSIRSSLTVDPPTVYRTETLCQRVELVDGAIDLVAWKACADRAATLDDVRDRLVAVVDVSIDSQHVALLAGGQTSTGKVKLAVVDAWRSTDEAKFRLPGLLAELGPKQVGWFPGGPSGPLAPLFRRDTVRPYDVIEIKGAAVTEACQGLADMVAARQVLHSDDDLLNAHIAGCKQFHMGDGWRFVRRGAGHVNAAYAAAGVVQLAQLLPAERPKFSRLVY